MSRMIFLLLPEPKHRVLLSSSSELIRLDGPERQVVLPLGHGSPLSSQVFMYVSHIFWQVRVCVWIQ